MGKRLFLLILISLIGVVSTPQFLTADDTVVLTGLDESSIVETVPLPEPEPEPVVETKPVVAEAKSTTANISTVAKSTAVAKPQATATQTVAEPVYTAPQVTNYTVSFYINSMNEYASTASNLSYNGIYKFRKMVYGHNTANLLGNLSSRRVGETITITEGGVAKSYRVADIQLYQKTADGNLNGDARIMKSIVNNAYGHSLALLTCAGTPLGNGDATHRLVVYVDAV